MQNAGENRQEPEEDVEEELEAATSFKEDSYRWHKQDEEGRHKITKAALPCTSPSGRFGGRVGPRCLVVQR